MGQPKISVIVPVWNRGDLIKPCVESILNQTFKDFELLLVDNNSIDQSLTICQQFADEHNNVYIYECKEQGASSTRNVGIRNARGEYIVFVDSDDTCKPEMLSVLYRTIIENSVDYVVGNASCLLGTETIVIKGKEQVRDYIGRYYKLAPFNPPVARIYKRELIKKIYDSDFFKCEDFVFNIQYIENIESLAIYPHEIYCVNTAYHVSVSREYHHNEFENYSTSQIILEQFVGEKYMTKDLKDRLYLQSKASILHCIECGKLNTKDTKEENSNIVYNDKLQKSLQYVTITSTKDKLYVLLLKCKRVNLLTMLFKMLSKRKR